MTYTIKRFSYNDQETVAVVQDSSVNTSLDINLVGRNLFAYGEFQNENFVYLLENFAGLEPPPKAIVGQLWFSVADETLKVCTSIQNNSRQWKALGVVVSPEEPAGALEGTFWYHPTGKTLKLRYGGAWELLSSGSSGALVSSDGSYLRLMVRDTEIAVVSKIDNSAAHLSKGLNIRGGYGVRVGDWLYTTEASLPVSTYRFMGNIPPDTRPAVIPHTNGTYDLGRPNNRWNMVYATASKAVYADLAEKYLADMEYPVGTVMMVGGYKEVTACTSKAKAIGVVSGHPAYLMNYELDGGTPIALKGRVPVKVCGSVKKGDHLGCGDNGMAVVSSEHIFGISLEDFDGDIGVVEAVIL